MSVFQIIESYKKQQKLDRTTKTPTTQRKKLTEEQKQCLLQMLQNATKKLSSHPEPFYSVATNEETRTATIVFNGIFKMGESQKQFRNMLQNAMKKYSRIILYLDTSGGSYVVVRSILKLMQTYKLQGGWLECIITKQCFSAGPMIAKECNVVKMHKDAKWMIHFQHGLTYEKIQKMKDDNVNPKFIAHELKEIELWATIWSEILKQPIEYIKEICNSERRLSAEEGIRCNFIDEIID